VLVHEFGHALMMRICGFRPWIVLYGMGGLTCRDPRDTYGVKRSHGTLGEVFIDAAGPGAGFLLTAILLAAFYLTHHGHQVVWIDPWGLRPYVWLWNEHVSLFLCDLLFVCVFWGLLNLLPIYPLDGGQIMREILVRISPREGIRLSLVVSILAAGAMAVYALKMKQIYAALLFGYLAFSSFATLQAYGGRDW
jgi:stage IV sporulation protein FB